MNLAIIAAVAAVLLALIGVAGTIVPMLPGSLTVGAGLLVWTLWGGGANAWLVFALGVTFLAVGMTASTLLTGRTLRRRAIPSRSVVVGLVAGVVGFFVIPVVGLPIGFALGLFGSEWARVRDAGEAVSTSLVALKSVGLGMLVEFGCASAAAVVLGVSILVRFFA